MPVNPPAETPDARSATMRSTEAPPVTVGPAGMDFTTDSTDGHGWGTGIRDGAGDGRGAPVISALPDDREGGDGGGSGRQNLVYTVAFDPPGSEGCRTLAKMLASSLLRTYFSGDILVFRNSSAPLFLVERKGLEEVFVETPDIHGLEGAQYSWCGKYRMGERVLRWMEERGGVDAWDKVLFLDADCLALRNIDHLLEGDWDIAYQPERGLDIDSPQFNAFLTESECREHRRDGVNSGTLAVAARHYKAVMSQWEQIDRGPVAEGRTRTCSDQGSWNRLLVETRLRKQPFERGEVQFPMYLQPEFRDYKRAALAHNLGGDTVDKIRFTFGLYMHTFFCDPSALFFNFLEI